MKNCYIIFEWFTDVRCENQIDTGRVSEKGKPIHIACKHPIRCSRIVRLVTTDRDLAITLTKKNPNFGYQVETLWTNLE